MINIKVNDGKICCYFSGPKFTDLIFVLKKYRCKYEPDGKYWILPRHKYNDILIDLSTYDTISISKKDEEIIQYLLSNNNKEQVIDLYRPIFNPNLLHYLPIKGKPPNEDFQLNSILKCLSRNRYALFLGMGTGKGYISAAIIAHLKNQNKAKKVLYISSNIGCLNMKHELLKFIKDLNEEEILLMYKVEKDRDIFNKKDKNIIITNYNTFRHICLYYNKTLKKSKSSKFRIPVAPIKEWLDGDKGILILDESHNIGNYNSQQTNAVLRHKDFFYYRYLFSGTPSDKPEKLYPQLKVLDESLVKNLSYYEWLDYYAILGDKFSPWSIVGWNQEKLKELNEILLKDYAIFKKTEECIDLPKNYIKKIYVPMSDSHRELYRKFILSSLKKIEETNNGNLIFRDVKNKFPYLHLSLDCPNLLLKNHKDILPPDLIKQLENFNYEQDNNKYLYMLNILEEKFEEDPNQQGLIWILHPLTGFLLQEKLKKYNPLLIVGETKNRDELLDTFKKNKKHKLLIASIPVLNTSITLTNCSFQIYLERVYNFSIFDQSMARILRIGQKNQVYTYILIFERSLDILQDFNLSKKEILNEKLLSKEFLSKEEWKTIFEPSQNETFNFLNI